MDLKTSFVETSFPYNDLNKFHQKSVVSNDSNFSMNLGYDNNINNMNPKLDFRQKRGVKLPQIRQKFNQF